VIRQRFMGLIAVAVADVAIAVVVNLYTDDLATRMLIPLVALVPLSFGLKIANLFVDDRAKKTEDGELVSAIATAVLPVPVPRHTLMLEASGEAHARREVRLLASVPQERLAAVLGWMIENPEPDIEVPVGQFRVLVGPMGSGKSEIAGRWWDQGLVAAAADESMALPLWIPARQIGDLRQAVAAALGLPDGPARVVIDDLDSVTASRAAEIIDDARGLVRAHPHLSILATSRPGAVLQHDEELSVAPWPARKGADLAELASGADLPLDFWEPDTAHLLTSPLLALAIAVRLRAHEDVRGSRFALLSGIARSIVNNRSRGQSSTDAWADLARLAHRILTENMAVSAESFGNEAQIHRLTDTNLVVENSGMISFALPLFEQHFGAQWITTDPRGIESAAEQDAFPRWRYALAFSIASSDPRAAEVLMLRLARKNPAALSWVLDEIRSAEPKDESWRVGRDDADVRSWLTRVMPSGIDTSKPLALLAGGWLREAHDSLSEGLEILGPLLSRSPRDGLSRWGLHLTRGNLSIAESRAGSPTGELVEIEETWPKSGNLVRTRQIYLSAAPLTRWEIFRKSFSEELGRHLRRRTLPVPPGSFLETERVWFLCRLITKARSWEDKPIPLSTVWEHLEPMVEQVAQSTYWRWRSGNEELNSDDVRWLEPRIRKLVADEIVSPWPPTDRVDNLPGATRYRYSPELDLSVTNDIFRQALVGYRQIVETSFPRFGDALGLFSMLPVRVTGLLIQAKIVERFDDGRSLYYSIRRADGGPRTREPDVRITLAVNPDEVAAYGLAEDENDGDDQTIFRPMTTSYGGAPLIVDRRATNLAYSWLARDLKAIGWTTIDGSYFD
jgi:hypothetical protein